MIRGLVDRRVEKKFDSQPILILSYFNSHFPQLLLLAEFIIKKEVRIIFIHHQNTQLIDGVWQKKISALGVPIYDQTGKQIQNAKINNNIHPSGASTHGTPTRPWHIRILRRIPGLIALATLRVELMEGRAFFFTLRTKLNLARALLDRFQPRLIILPEENSLLGTSVYTKTARRKGVASMIVPYTIADASEFAEADNNNPRLQVRGKIRNILRRLFPRWVYLYKGNPVTLLSWPRILAMELLRLSPPDPWMLNSGFSSAIAVESQYMLEYYRQRNLPENQLHLTGSLSDDVLFQTIKQRSTKIQEIITQYGLDRTKPLLLCAMPPPWYARPECDFPSYEMLVSYWLRILSEVDTYNVILNLHPRINSVEFQRLNTSAIPIVNENIASLIPVCDIYVASITATIRWAIACGIPVMNYDVYRGRLHDYDTAPGVVTFETREEFASSIQRISHDQDYYHHLTLQQQRVQRQWGILDGQCGERLWKLIEQLSS